MIRLHRWLKPIAALLLLATSACASTSSVPDLANLTFFVGSDGTLQPGVEISIVTGSGSKVTVAETDASGSASVPMAVLTDHRAICLLFSKEGFFTTALWLPGYPLGEQQYIGLAKFTVM